MNNIAVLSKKNVKLVSTTCMKNNSVKSDNSVCKVALHNCVGGCFYPLVSDTNEDKHMYKKY